MTHNRLHRHQQQPPSRAFVHLVLLAALALASTLLWSAAAQAYQPSSQDPVPTAGPCDPPTLRTTLNSANVRGGPGLAYPVIAQLNSGEVHPIIGRAEFVEFWQIELADGRPGWISNSIVVVEGYIGGVPIVDAPLLDGVQPTRGTSVWSPTPDGSCLATYTPAPAQLLATPSADSTANAINANDDGWMPPTNLSRSGVAEDPQVVVDATGVVHVLWQEQEADGFVYTRRSDEGWLEPEVIEVPFGTRRLDTTLRAQDPVPLFTPVLIAAGAEGIHAIWLDDGVVLYSGVSSAQITSYEAWSAPVTIAEDALDVAAAAGEDGRLHVAYLRATETEETPAGVFYLQSADGGATWREPLLLQSSSYLRAATTDNARVQIAATGTGDNANVYVAWDSPIVEKVFLTRSPDGGTTWVIPIVIDSRRADDRDDATGPNRVSLTAVDDEVLVLWQAGHGNTVCQQYFRYSDDGAFSWKTEDVLSDDFDTCPTESDPFYLDRERGLLFAQVGQRPNLLAWDGEEWSEPQEQEILAQFTNPETFREVVLSCHQVRQVDDQILVVGCGTGNGLDIWTTQREIGPVVDWYPPPSLWSEAAVVTSDSVALAIPSIVADSTGRLHALWIAKESDSQRLIIQYAQTRNGEWQPPRDVLRSPEGDVRHLAVTQTDDDRLLTAWTDSGGQIYFSQSQAAQAATARGWLEPIALPLPRAAVNAAAVVQDKVGDIYIAFAIAINEDRGIYLTRSQDEGRSWEQPEQVFDGAEAGWERVGAPSLVVDQDGIAHLMWSQYGKLSVEGEPATALYYAGTRFGERTTPTPELVSEGPISWSKILGTADGLIHRLWQINKDEEWDEARFTYHNVSGDAGRSWSEPMSFSNAVGPIAVTNDRVDQLHALLFDGINTLEYKVNHGEEWQLKETIYEYADGDTVEILDASLTIGDDEQLAILYQSKSETNEGETSFNLFSSSRVGAAGPSMPAPETLTAQETQDNLPDPTPPPTLTPVASASATPTATAFVAPEGESAQPPILSDANSVNSTLIAGILPVALLILLIAGIGFGIRARFRN